MILLTADISVLYEMFELVVSVLYIDLDFFGTSLKPIHMILGLGIADTLADIFYMIIRRGDDGREVYSQFDD